MYSRASFGTTTATSPPVPAFRNDPFGTASVNALSHTFSTSPKTERHPSDRIGAMPTLSPSFSDPSSFAHESRPAPAIVIRRLPRTIGVDALKSMLLFAGDLIDTELIRSPYPEDQGFATAVARFQTSAGALEAQQKLHGKPNTTKEANMIVEAHTGSAMSAYERRNTVDGTASRTQSSSASSGASGIVPPPRSRFGSTYQSTDKISPPLPTPNSSTNGEFPIPESSAHFQNLFSPQSPLSNGMDAHHWVSGKSVINDDSADDDTGDILKDPLAYAKSGPQPGGRRQTNPQLPITRFGSLSLSTAQDSNSINGLVSPPTSSSGMTSPRNMNSAHPSISPMSPANLLNSSQPPNPYLHNFTRPQYPPVNPADQNPPCNTLYVGNLPIDTSEDELKHVFSKQRGYKRLCFRTKQNGPMCFVEFEDISFATKALHELYGHPLRNSVKGGIRLSFSKNPLGVRSGQTNGGILLPPGQHINSPGGHPSMYGGLPNGSNLLGSVANSTNNANPPSQSTPIPGPGMNAGVNFSSVTGPPPGLGSPPGLQNGAASSSNAAGAAGAAGRGYRAPLLVDGGMFANPFGMASHEFAAQLSPRGFGSGGGSNGFGQEGGFGSGRDGFGEYGR